MPTKNILILYLLSQTAKAQGENNELFTWDWYKPWKNIIRYLIAFFFIVFGLHTLLYFDIATYLYMKQYIQKGTLVQGDVLSCDDTTGDDGKVFIHVLYETLVHKFAHNPRLKFRHPNAVERKRYLRRFETWNGPLPRGSMVEVLVLKGQPQSGLTREMVETTIRNFSTVRVCLLVTPCIFLLIVILYLAVVEVQDMPQDRQMTGWIVLLVGIALALMVSRCWYSKRFEEFKRKRFNCAMSMVNSGGRGGRTNQSHSGLSQPLHQIA